MIKTLPQSLLEQSKKMFEQQLYESIMLTEDRIQFLKANMPDISTDHDVLATHTNHADIIDHFAEHGDPTKNKRYTQWIMNRYKDKDFRQEDAPRIHDALTLFDKHKAKLDKKDINSYKSISDLASAVSPYREKPATKAEATAESIEKGRTLIHDDGATKVYRLEQGKHGKAASQAIYGGGSDLGGTHTDWCTAARSEHCMYDHYTKYKPLYVIHGKDGSVYQAHPDTLQFMDAKDRPVTQDAPEDVKNALNHIPDGHHLKVSHDLGPTIEEMSDAYYNGGKTILKTQVLTSVSTPSDVVAHAADNQDDGNIRALAAKNENASHDVLEKLMHDKSVMVRAAVASNPSASKDQLDRLYSNSSNVGHSVANNPSTGEETLGKMLDQGEHIFAIAGRSGLSNEFQHKIADTRPELIASVAHDGNDVSNHIFHHALHKLSLDPNKKYDRDYLLRVASKNKNGDASMVSELMQKSDPYGRTYALSSPHVTQDHIKAGLFDRDFMVKDAASKHNGLTFETAKFFTDNDHTPLNNGMTYTNFRNHPTIGKQISEYLDQKGIK